MMAWSFASAGDSRCQFLNENAMQNKTVMMIMDSVVIKNNAHDQQAEHMRVNTSLVIIEWTTSSPEDPTKL